MKWFAVRPPEKDVVETALKRKTPFPGGGMALAVATFDVLCESSLHHTIPPCAYTCTYTLPYTSTCASKRV
ncbi:MAG TPA: hypothetical protein DIS79_11225 [Bacteroidetes bacterium]|nr:hypothetical protein [Bacteroidota bacterium]